LDKTTKSLLFDNITHYQYLNMLKDSHVTVQAKCCETIWIIQNCVALELHIFPEHNSWSEWK